MSPVLWALQILSDPVSFRQLRRQFLAGELKAFLVL
jgi:hypothetical protein